MFLIKFELENKNKRLKTHTFFKWKLYRFRNVKTEEYKKDYLKTKDLRHKPCYLMKSECLSYCFFGEYQIM